MNITNFMPARVISGRGCLNKNSELFAKLGSRALIVTGKSSAKNSGAFDDIIEILKKENIAFSLYDAVEANPQTRTCHMGGFVARAFNADFIIGIGGGSVMDAAKAIAIYTSNPQFNDADIYNRIIPANRIPVVLVGTTSGTGSEVTGVSVLTNTQNGLKKSISGEDCYSVISFCDYYYTKSTDSQIRVSAALDAFAHAVESYFAQGANDISSLYALRALELLSPFIINNRFSDLDDAELENLYMASVYAGYAINITGTCFPHTVGYYLTENFNIPHGKACTAFFDILYDKAKENCPDRVETILTVMNCNEDKLLSAIKSLTDVKVNITADVADKVCLRWDSKIKNFDRTPGGFSFIDAKKALRSLTD